MEHVIIGRAPECDVRVPASDQYAGLRHARISGTPDDPGSWTLMDLGSTNGTRVIRHGQVTRVLLGQVFPLREGDIIVVGRTTLPPFMPRAVSSTS